MRTLLLWMARNAWLKERLPKLWFAKRAIRRFMPGEDAESALDAAVKFRADGIASMLRPGGMDLVITVRADFESDLCHVALFSDRYVCVVRANHPQVGEQMTLDLFRRLPRLEWGLGTVLISSTAEQHFKDLGGPVQMTTESFALAPFVLGCSDLVAVLQERLARRFKDAAGVKLLDLPISVPDLTEVMYWSPVVDSEPAHRWLRRTILGVAGTL